LLNSLNELNFCANNILKSKSVVDFKTQIRKEGFSLSSSNIEGKLALINSIAISETELASSMNFITNLATDDENIKKAIMPTLSLNEEEENVSKQI
jgi:hypothetical protein